MREHHHVEILPAVSDDSRSEAAASSAFVKCVLPPEATADVGRLLLSFQQSYEAQKATVSLAVWLNSELARHDVWKNAADLEQAVAEIIETSTALHNNHNELQAHLARGKQTASWLAGKIEQGTAAAGSISVGRYAGQLDTALYDATQHMQDAVTTLSGEINRNPSLHGFIAEQHHVNTFNLDAAAKGSSYRARVLEPEPGTSYGKNSVDIGVYDENGKLVRRYQSKYCESATKTEQAFEQGQYNGQRKLVPTDQVDDVKNATDVIEVDGVTSKPLSHEESKKMRERAQIDQEIKEYTWNDLTRVEVAKKIGKQALTGAAIGVAFQGGRILARRAWNALMGNAQPEASEDVEEFFESSAKTAASVGVITAMTGAVTVAARNGRIPLLRHTPAGWIAGIVYMGLEQAKVSYKFLCGELDGPEAIDAMGNAACTSAGTLGGGILGVQAGAALGSVLGPVGTVVGGFVGGIAGGMAGGAVMEGVYEGAKKLASTIVSSVKEICSWVSNGFSSICNAIFG